MISSLSKKNRQITYEELVSSHFMKHPSSNRIVYAVFNPFVVAAIILVATTTYAALMDGDWGFAIIIGVLCSMFLSIKMAMVSMQMTGHGVGMIQKGKLSVLGLPTAAVVMFFIIFFLISAITYIAYTAPNGGFQRVQMMGVSLLFSFIMSLLSWRFHSYYANWYGSEYVARMEFKSKGNSDEVIETKIKKLKKIGIIL